MVRLADLNPQRLHQRRSSTVMSPAYGDHLWRDMPRSQRYRLPPSSSPSLNKCDEPRALPQWRNSISAASVRNCRKEPPCRAEPDAPGGQPIASFEGEAGRAATEIAAPPHHGTRRRMSISKTANRAKPGIPPNEACPSAPSRPACGPCAHSRGIPSDLPLATARADVRNKARLPRATAQEMYSHDLGRPPR